MVRVHAGRGSVWCREPANTLTGLSPGTTACRSPREKHAQHTLQLRHPLAHHVRAVGRSGMDVLYERCCGLDIHKKLVVAWHDHAKLEGHAAQGSTQLRHDD